VICKAALAVLRAVQKEKILANVAAMGGYLTQRLEELKKAFKVIKDVRGCGLMIGVELDTPGKPLVEACYDKGLLINCTHDVVLRVMPALNVTSREIDNAVVILKEVFKTTL